MHVFLVGMPRSGTTVIFEALAARHDVAWFSNYFRRCPDMPVLSALSRLVDLSPRMRWSMGRSDQTKSWLERLGIGPDEAYPVWRRCCGDRFQFDYLLGVQATPAEKERVRATVADVRRYQGKPHFAAKLTGPGRIGYLSSIFPDARFVHVLRDGRAVVQSLMKISFWRQRNRMNRPAWRNGLTERDLADWERHERSPLALAAVQWRRVIESTREEAASRAPDRYAEIKYERFVAEPHRALDEIAEFYGLPHSTRVNEFLQKRLQIRDMNWQWRERFNDREIAMLNELLHDLLEQLGYRIDAGEPTKANPAVTAPFRFPPTPVSNLLDPGGSGVSRQAPTQAHPGRAEPAAKLVWPSTSQRPTALMTTLDDEITAATPSGASILRGDSPPSMACVICDGATQRLFEKNGFWILLCEACGHRAAELTSATGHVERVYSNSYFQEGGAGYPDYHSEARILRQRGQWYARLLRRHRPAGRVLDVGAAAGFVLQGLVDGGWSGRGVEPNARMAAFARDSLGLDVTTGMLEELPVIEEYDLVAMIQVVSHFIDPRRALQVAARHTAPGGSWLIETWNRESRTARIFGSRWHEYSPPSVLHWFSPDGLRRLAAEMGFREIARGRPSKWIGAAHAKSLLRSRIGASRGGRMIAAAVGLIPDRVSLPYPGDDLFWALFERDRI